MTTELRHTGPLRPALLAILVLASLAAHPVAAQVAGRAPVSSAAVSRHAEGLALEKRGDENGAYTAFLESATEGYPPAQRRLGEIYDRGNSAVPRDYESALRWYQQAREGGERIPVPLVRPLPTTFGRPILLGR